MCVCSEAQRLRGSHMNDVCVCVGQEYEQARADALEQIYTMASGAISLATRSARPQLIHNNLCDCIKIGSAALKSLKEGKPVDIEYY